MTNTTRCGYTGITRRYRLSATQTRHECTGSTRSYRLSATQLKTLCYNGANPNNNLEKVQLRLLKLYIPLVTRCYRCQGYGHVAHHCYKPTDVCPVCAGSHKFNACPTNDQKKCATAMDIGPSERNPVRKKSRQNEIPSERNPIRTKTCEIEIPSE